ncbi:hypothetical protein SLA2020_057910 [Shorea laevis]
MILVPLLTLEPDPVSQVPTHNNSVWGHFRNLCHLSQDQDSVIFFPHLDLGFCWIDLFMDLSLKLTRFLLLVQESAMSWNLEAATEI